MDLKYYPLEKLAISFQTGTIVFSQNDTLINQSALEKSEIDLMSELLENIGADAKNRIYNPSMFWNIELELRAFCREESGNFAIKSFGQHGETPQEVLEVYRQLLQRLAQFSTEASQRN